MYLTSVYQDDFKHTNNLDKYRFGCKYGTSIEQRDVAFDILASELLWYSSIDCILTYFLLVNTSRRF
jgi:hypothetical protein